MNGSLNVYNFASSYKSVPLFDKDIDKFKNAKQIVSDCYLMSTLDALSHTQNGRKVLKNQLRYNLENPQVLDCYLHNKQGQQEKYSIPISKAIEGYEELYNVQPNNFVRSLDITVAEYEKKYKSKPWICNITERFKKFKFENNLPSHFMTVLTGVKPRAIAETDLNLSLKGYKKQVMKLFEQMEREKDYSFVIGTGIKKLDGRRFHVYVIENVDLKNNTITVKEKRSNTPKVMDIDEALGKFKYITGYFNSDLTSHGNGMN